MAHHHHHFNQHNHRSFNSLRIFYQRYEDLEEEKTHFFKNSQKHLPLYKSAGYEVSGCSLTCLVASMKASAASTTPSKHPMIARRYAQRMWQRPEECKRLLNN